jgi:hypothetical protein
MRRFLVVPLVFAAAACGGGGIPVVHRLSLEGQSPPEAAPAAPTGLPKEPPPPNSALAASPAWLRANSPIAWTCPQGWEEIQSTKPQRLVEFTIEQNGPGNAPLQFLILNGADDHPQARNASIARWQTFYREDQAQQTTVTEQNGVKVTKMRTHGEYEGQNAIGTGDVIKEANWTMICGFVEGPNGSIMFKVQGPDAVIKTHEARIDQLLASMKPSDKK